MTDAAAPCLQANAQGCQRPLLLLLCSKLIELRDRITAFGQTDSGLLAAQQNSRTLPRSPVAISGAAFRSHVAQILQTFFQRICTLWHLQSHGHFLFSTFRKECQFFSRNLSSLRRTRVSL